MHTETNAMMLNNIQQQTNSHQQHTEHQHDCMAHLSQDHLMSEQNQQVFTHLPSTTTETKISLSEGLYTTTPKQHLTSEYLSQYYSGTSRVGYQPTSSSSSSSSSLSSSSDDSSYSRHKSSENSMYRNNNKQTSSIGVNLRVTGQCSQGGRKYMEDYFSVAYQQSENANDLEYAFIGIYDGHGGAEAAKFAKEHLMMEIINQRLFWSDNDHDVLRAIREGYIATHYAMWRDQDKWPKTANGLPSTAGTTATVAFIRRGKIYIGHVGDSGIVLGYQNEHENFWRAKQLTIDHKPESVEERTRIMNSGGKVVVKSGVPRVVWNRPRNANHRGPIRKKTLIDEIPFLAVARSLGDLWSYNSERNEFVVSPDPDVKVVSINPNTFRCLIFGTDGLWNVVSAQEAVNTVRDKEVINERLLAQRGDSPHEGNQWTNPSKSLVEQALRTWSHKKMRADNTSVVTVILYPPGQVDHNTEAGCNVTSIALNNPPAFLQPISYGLEYTQVQAEFPAHDDATTYKEMALKYLPPEPFRNFNYYADESDTEGDDNEESEEEEDEAKPSPGDLAQNTAYNQSITTSNNWIWQDNNASTYTGAIPAEADVDQDDDEGEHDEEEADKAGQESKEKPHVSNERCIINYQNYEHMEAEETNNATDSYINTFAESYNSLLVASQDECIKAAAGTPPTSSLSSNSNSNSNSNCQSVTPPNMHDILQEQQRYQQQCMSEEEGYSLTKLETRREQQTFNKSHNRNTRLSNETTAAIQTFKIFHESHQDPQQVGMYHSNTGRFYHHQEGFMHQMGPKPLELHSLLQQEREEEQQVAYERLQMENKLQHQQNIAGYACLQTENRMTASLEEQPSVEEEYLVEESIVAEEDIISAENSCLQQDESVQIHEISSSSCGDESRSEISHSEIHFASGEILERIEILPNAIFGTKTDEQPEEIRNEILMKTSKYSIITNSKNRSCLPPTPPQTSPAVSTLPLTASLKSSLSRSKRTKSTYLYNNVPNENLQRISNSKYNHNMFTPTGAPRNSQKNICMTPSANMTPPAATSTPMIQRQLRSTTTPCATPIIDYGKRTLRTRNSLSKDMKSKSSLVQAALKYTQNAVTRNFLRTTAANLMVGKSLHINDLNVTSCSRRSLGTANNVRSPNRSSIKARREKQNVVINGSLNQSKANMQNLPHSQLNLRSRQTTLSSSSATSPPSTNVCALRSPSTPVIKRASLTERRIHTRSSSSKGSQTPANFSKSTRTQSTGSNLAAPPPSPKLINAVAAVAAATRARSLLNAKHVAAANGTQSVVSAVFGKRTSLRSNVSTHPAVLPNTSTASLSSPSATHQTLRGRIVKKLKR